MRMGELGFHRRLRVVASTPYQSWMKEFVVTCVLKNIKPDYTAFKIWAKKKVENYGYVAIDMMLGWSQKKVETAIQAQYAKLPIKNLGFSAFDPNSILSVRSISKLVWWWIGSHRAGWLREYLSRGLDVPAKFKSPPPVAYRVMKLSAAQVQTLNAGKTMETNDYSSWSPDLPAVKKFMKLEYFKDRKQGKGYAVIFKIKPTAKDVVVRLTDLLESNEVRRLMRLDALLMYTLFTNRMIRDTLEYAMERRKDRVTEIILNQVSLTKSNILEIHESENKPGVTE